MLPPFYNFLLHPGEFPLAHPGNLERFRFETVCLQEISRKGINTECKKVTLKRRKLYKSWRRVQGMVEQFVE
jgi:hypothetical protein